MGIVPNRGFNRGGFNRGGFNHRPGENGFRGGGGMDERRGFHRGFERHRFFPFAGFPGPFLYPPILDYGLPFGYGFDDDMENNGSAYQQQQQEPSSDEQALEMGQEAMADQLQRLNAEIADLKSARQDGRTPPPSSPYASPYTYTPPYAQPEAQPAPAPQPPLTLVLRDGQVLKIHSYAVMNQTFWDFSTHPVGRIPLSSIDIAASEKATEANGGEFPAISVSQ
jgi:hypothetical protein